MTSITCYCKVPEEPPRSQSRVRRQTLASPDLQVRATRIYEDAREPQAREIVARPPSSREVRRRGSLPVDVATSIIIEVVLSEPDAKDMIKPVDYHSRVRGFANLCPLRTQTTEISPLWMVYTIELDIT